MSERLEPFPIAELGLGRTTTLDQRVAQLFQELRSAVYFYLVSTGSRPAEAEEISQEAFLRLYRELRMGHQVESLRAWIFRVAHNLAIDRRKAERNVEPLAPEIFEELAEARMDPALNPEERASEEQRLSRVRDVLGALSPQQQQCLHLRAEGFTYREGAGILDITESSVKEFIRRAVRRLKGSLL